MTETINFTLNGKPASVNTDADRKLLWVLRSDLGLTGTKYGCGESFCGACTVLVNGEAVRSCQIPLKNIRGKDIVTIEGLAHNGVLHPVQQAFIEHDAMQCGYCTPGMIMQAVALLKQHPKPAAAEVIAGMDDNFCRCGAHNRIIRAIQAASKEMEVKD